MLSQVRSTLGRPFYEADDVLIYNMDCLAGMSLLNPGLVDLTVTSPPYNIGKEYETVKPLEDYLCWCEEWIAEVYRLTNQQGAFWLNLGYIELHGRAKAIPIAYLLWNRVPFYLMQEVVWHYEAGVAAKRMLSPRNEKFLWYVRSANEYVFNLDSIRDLDVKYPHQKKNGKLKCNPLGKNPSDVWEIPKVTSGQNRSSKERTAHVAQFPLAVVDRIVRASSNERALVLDPFIGSGTTAVAALHNQRQVLGFEINPEYCRIAASRIEDYLQARNDAELQLEMFGSASSMSLLLRASGLRWACCPVAERCPSQSAWSSQPKRISLISG